MTAGPANTRPRRRRSLDVLGRSLRDARATVRQCRHGPVGSSDLIEARRELITALDDYTAALEERHLPVPHALRTELAMHRALFD